MTNHELAALLLARPEAEITDAHAKRVLEPKSNQPGQCWCGCGQTTKSKFVPGHDSRFHGLAKRVARGEEATPTTFVHAEAEADFRKWHDAEAVAHAAREQEKAHKKATKEAKKATKDATATKTEATVKLAA